MTRRQPLISGIVLGGLLLTLTSPLAWAQVFGSSSVASQVEELRSGDAVRDIRAERGQELYFRVYVPSDADELLVETAGGRGDADLYIRHGSLPGKAAFDARSTGSSTRERIEIRRPREGWWYITLRGFTDFADVDMGVEHDGRDAGDIDRPDLDEDVLRDGERVRGLRGQAGERLRFRIEVPYGADTLRLRMDGGRGDADLYLSARREPTPKAYEHRSVGRTTREELSIRRPEAGTWYVVVYAYSDFSDAELVVDIDGGRYGDDDIAIRGLELLRPAGRTVWLLGGTEVVAWRADRSVREVQIQFSLDGGRTWRRDGLPARVDADRGEYFVKLPASRQWASDRGRIRIVDVDNPRRYVLSEVFRITADRDDDRDDEGDRYEPDDRLSRASRILLGEAQQRTINPDEDEDYILFVPDRRDTYVANFAHVTETLKVDVLRIDERNRQQKLEDFEVGREGAQAIFQADAGTRGIVFRVRAEDDDDTGRYVLLIQRDNTNRGRLPVPLPPRRVPAPQPRVNATVLPGDNDKVENLSGQRGSARYFKVYVPRNAKQLSVATEDGDGNIALYLEQGQAPTRQATWQSNLRGVRQYIRVDNPQPGWYHVLLYGQDRYSGVEIGATVK